MGAKEVIKTLRKNISAEDLPCIIAALRRDHLIWDSLNDPILMGKMLNFSTGERKFWSPANIAVLAVNDIAPEQFNLYPPEAWPIELQQNVKLTLPHMISGSAELKDIRDVAFIVLGLKNKYRENLNWRETFSYLIDRSDVEDTAQIEKNKPVFACLYDLVTDPRQFIRFTANDIPGGYALAIHAVLTQPLEEADQQVIFENLLQSMALDDALDFLQVLENANCKSLIIKLAKSLLESSGLEKAFSESDDMTVKQLRSLSTLQQLANEPKEAVQTLNKATSILGELSKDITRSKGHIALYQLDDDAFKEKMRSEIYNLASKEDEKIVNTAAVLIDRKQLSNDELPSLEPEIQILYAAGSEKDHDRAKTIVFGAVESIIRSGSFASNLVAPDNVLKALKALKVDKALVSLENFFLQAFSNDLGLVKTIRDMKLDRGDHHEAEEACQLVAAIEPQDLDNRRILGNLNIKKGEWEEAYGEFSYLNEHNPDSSVEDQISLAEVSLNTGRQKEAKNLSEKIIAGDEKRSRVYICAGRACLALNDLNLASGYLKKATELDPEAHESWEGLAEYFQHVGDEAKELETLKKGLRFSPDSGAMNYRMSQILLDQERFTETLPYLEKAVKLIPGTRQIALDLSRSLRKTGRVDDAASVIGKAREKWADDPYLAYEEGEIYYFNQQLEKAAQSFQFALATLDPQIDWCWQYGKVLIDLEEQTNLDDVIDRSALNKAYQMLTVENFEPGDIEKVFIIAKMSFLLGRHDQALEQYRKLMENRDTASEFWQEKIQIGIGQAALANKKPEIALAALKEADTRMGNDLLGKKLLAEAYYQTGLVPDAIAVAEEVPVILPLRPAHLLWFARFMKKLEKYDESLKAYRNVAELLPHDLLVLVECAQAEEKVGNKDQALQILKHLLSNDAGSPSIWEQAAKIADSIEENSMAITFLKKAIEKTGHVKVDQVIKLAILENKEGNISGAIQSIDNMRNNIPAQRMILEISAILQAEAGDFTKAIELMKNSFTALAEEEMTPDLPDAWNEMIATEDAKWFTLCKWAKSAGKLADGFIFIENAFNLTPDNIHYRKEAAILASILLEDEKLRKLLQVPEREIVQRLSEKELDIRHKEDYATLYALNAHISLEDGEIDLARQYVADASEFNPDCSFNRIVKCRISALKGDINSGRNTIQDLDSENPLLPSALLDMECWSDAIQATEKYLEGHPQEPIAWLNLIKVYVKESEIRQFRQLLGIQANLPDLDNLAFDCKERASAALKQLDSMCVSHQINEWNARFQLLFSSSLQEVTKAAFSETTPESVLAIALALLRLNCYEECSKICTTFPKDSNLSILRSQVLSKIDAEAAIKAGQWAIEIDPENIFSHIALAKTCELTGETRTALQAFEKALELRPDFTELHGEAAKMSLDSGDSVNAMLHLAAAHQADPENEEIVLALGKAYFKENQIENAISILKDYTTNYGKTPETIIDLAKAYAASGNKQLAINQIEQIENEFPLSFSRHLECSHVLLECGELQKAFDFARKAAMISPDSPEVVILIAEIVARKNGIQQALQLLEKSIEKGQNEYAVLKTRALYSFEIAGEETSLPLFEELLTKEPEDAEILSRLARMAFHKSEHDKAKEYGLAALKFGDQSHQTHQILGNIYHTEGNLDKAIFHLSKAIELKPDLQDVYLELSKVYNARRAFNQGIETLCKAVEYIPDNPDLYLALAGLLKDSKDYRQAEIMLRKAMELMPDDLNIRRQLGAVVALNLIHSSQEVHYAYEH